MSVKILLGDCRDILPALDAESVQCCVTSPPYWGLRDYGLPPSVWGGDAECEHMWGNELLTHQRGKVGDNSTLDGGPQAGGDGRLQDTNQGRFCQLCGAWLGCLGLEPTPELYVEHLVGIFRQVRRVLRDDGVLWVNLGDSLDKKQLQGIPWRVAFALQADGWWLRSDVIWHKPNCMPESVTDRPTKAHEYMFLLSKSARYFYDAHAIREPHGFNRWSDRRKQDASVLGEVYKGNVGNSSLLRKGPHNFFPNSGRNKRTVWTIPTRPFPEAHFATFPPDLVEPCIKAGSSERGCCPVCGVPWERVVEKSEPRPRADNPNPVLPYTADSGHTHGTGATTLHKEIDTITTGWQPTCTCPDHDPIPCTILDPFGGAGTVGLVADRLGRDAVLIELNQEYAEMARARITQDAPMFAEIEIIPCPSNA